MNKLKGKIVINSRADFELYAGMMKQEAFFAKYVLSEKLLMSLTAEDAVNRSAGIGAN
jgi:hypothetical protein